MNTQHSLQQHPAKGGARSSTAPERAERKAAPGAGVLEKAMNLLNIVSKNRAPMTFTELFRQASLPKASLHRTLATLTREGLLRHDPFNKTFKLGFRLLELAHEVWSDFDLRLAAQDELTRLRDQQEECILLATLDQDQVVVVACEEAGRQATMSASTGTLLSLPGSALGHAIAAHLDPVRQRRLLDEGAARANAADPARWKLEMQARWNLSSARGYAMVRDDIAPNCLSLAVPVFDIEGRPVGAIGLTGAAERLDEPRAHALSSELIGAARRIAHNAGGQAMSIRPQSPPVPNGEKVQWECVVPARSLLGEGPTWSTRDSALYWVDILTPSVHCHRGPGLNTSTPLGSMVSVAVPKTSGGLLVATPSGLMGWPTPEEPLEWFSHPDSERANNRYNDGKCDRRGRLWVGSMDMGATANRGSLFKVEADGQFTRMESGLTVANGLGWSPDNRLMYFTDSFRRTIYQYEFDLDAGTLSNRRPLIVLGPEEGSPDGLTVDQDGCLWVALWDAWSVVRFNPQGREVMRVRLPVPRPTSCCFGGSRLDTLYVTSASVRLSAQSLQAAPLSGSLFALQIPGVKGLPETLFAG
jgi:sugar lactone lactonase YvrE/DNA-binding IclR family transcriptional regulator